MYRPVIFMGASDHQSTTTIQDYKTTAEPTTKTSSSTSRGAIRSTNKPSSSAKPNNKKPKKPQRGVGVEQLERLRLQRAGNAAAFTNQVQILPHPSKPQTQILQTHHHHQFQCSYQNPGSQADALRSVPVLYGASGYEGGVSGGGGFDYGGYNVRLQNEIGGLVMEPNSQYGVAGAHQDVGAVFHVSKKQQPLASASSECRCCCCNQNKILSSGNNMNFGEFPAIFPMLSGSNPPGFNSHNSPNVRLASENGGRGFCGGAYLSSRSGVVDESVEVRAVHRKGRQAGGDILMEYEFFPDHNRNNRNNNISSVISSSAAGTYPMEHDFVPLSTNSSSVGRSSEASDHHQHPDGAACIEGNQMRMMMSSSGYSPVDLSLKLSF